MILFSHVVEDYGSLLKEKILLLSFVCIYTIKKKKSWVEDVEFGAYRVQNINKNYKRYINFYIN